MYCPIELPKTIRDAKNLPSPPSIALEILRITKDPEANINELVDVLSSDPAITAKVVALSNTPRYRRGKAVTSLAQASTVLGMRTINILALGFSLTQSLPKSGQCTFDYTMFWRRSLTSGVVARALVRFAKTRVGEEAFLCGLLSRLGQLIFATTMGEKYDSLLASTDADFPAGESEKDTLGFDFHEVGAALLNSWGMPQVICSAVALWESDLQEISTSESDSEDVVTLCQFLKFSDACAELLCSDSKADALTTAYQRGAEILGLTRDEIDAFVGGLQEDLRSTEESFSMPIMTDIQAVLDEARHQAIDIALAATSALQDEKKGNAALVEQNEFLATAANTDALTQLPNRSCFDERLAIVVTARMNGAMAKNLGILILDVDHFKLINDTHGHTAGDEVLKTIAQRLVGATRDTDFFARYGGEEFVAILPNTTLDDLCSVAERLRLRISRESIMAEGIELHVSISVGGACIERIHATADGHELLKAADRLLYDAKHAGRNQSKCERIQSAALSNGEATSSGKSEEVAEPETLSC